MLQEFINTTNLLELAVGVRLPNDIFFREGNSSINHVKKFGIYETDSEDLLHEPIPLFSCQLLGCNKTFDTVYQFEQHYNSNHRYSCGTCKKSMTSSHLLDLHICETHDSYFSVQSEKKPMFRCYLEECQGIFFNIQLRKNHCIEVHNFPSNFFNDRSLAKLEKEATVSNGKNRKSKENVKNKIKNPGTKNSVDSSERMDVTVESTKISSDQKPLGGGNRHNRRKIFTAFERDMAASLPKLDS